MSSVTRTYFMLDVVDMGRAVAFYRGVLGEVIRSESDTWTELKLGEATVALHAAPAPKPRATGLAVEVTDLQATVAAVRVTGGQVVSEPAEVFGQLQVEVADTEGNTFSLVQEGTPS